MTMTTTDVKRLREQTGAGVMRCKAALEETRGDFDKAVVLLRWAAVETAAKRADRVAAHSEADVNGLLGVQLDDGTLADAVAGLSSASGEKVEIGRIARLSGRTTVYLHTAAGGLPPRIGALVAFDGGPGADERVHRVALQVTASSPQYLTRDDIPADVLAAVHAEAEELARAQGKAEAIVPRIVAGRVERFVHDTVLLEQVSVVDPGRTVKDLLFGTGVHITGFVRLEVGSGRR